MSSPGDESLSRDDAGLSILAAIDGRPPRRVESVRSRSRHWWTAALGLAVLGVAAGWWHTTQGREGSGGSPASDQAQLLAKASKSSVLPAAPASSVARDQAGSTLEPPLSGSPAVAASAPLPAGAASAFLARVEELKEPAAASAPVPQATTAALVATAESSAAVAPAKPMVLAESKPAAKSAGVSAAKAASPKSGHGAKEKTSRTDTVAQARPATRSRSSTAASADSDVELIAAVIRHVDGGQLGAPAAGRTATSKAGREAEGDASIASLVARCKSQGGAEALACRRRICDGYWGKAEACPAHLAPASSTLTHEASTTKGATP